MTVTTEPIPQHEAAVLTSSIILMDPEESAKFFKALFYGDPGVGKTVLAGSAADVPEMQDVLFVDAERGTLSLRKRGEHLKVTPCSSFSDLYRILDFLYEENHDRFKTVVLDSLSAIHTFGMRETDERLRKASRSGAVDGREVFGNVARDLDVVLKALYDKDLHLIGTCHEKEVKDDRTGEVRVFPALPGQLATGVARYFDLVARLYVHAEFKEGTHDVAREERRLITSAHYKYAAKDRSGNLSAEVIDPTLKSLTAIALHKND